jgi:hypothetical protein
MKNKERDLLDDLFRQKLQHLEAETTPEDWEAILMQLPGRKVILRGRQRWYWVAAACVALLTGSGGIYLSLHHEDERIAIADKTAEPPATGAAHGFPSEPQEETPPVAPGKSPVHPAIVRPEEMPPQPVYPAETIRPKDIITAKKPASPDNNKIQTVNSQMLIADAAPLRQTERKTSALRKWGFGTGMGFTQSSGEVVNTYVLRSSNYLADEELLSLNAASDQNQGKMPKTNIKHKTPVAFGFSASRYLNDRFSLQTGLVYSLLISDWETQATAYNNKTRQTLHFIGIPLSLSYKIAEWNRFRVYASAGMQVDMNVAGRLQVKRYSDNLQTGVTYINQRMKEWQWSANARAGISYPLIPYISIFGEIGAAYYFDNGSDIETIYSDKALNISPQIGLRLSF